MKSKIAKSVLSFIVVILTLIFLVHLHVSKINFSSLSPVFEKGDYVFKSYFYLKVKKGDYVCYSPVVNDRLLSLLLYGTNMDFNHIEFCGKIIGVQGDVVEDKKDFIKVGVETYQLKNSDDFECVERTKFLQFNVKIVVPKDKVYVITNEFHSIDSRYIGCIDISDIKFKFFK